MYVEMKNIYKKYGDFAASNNVSFGVEKGKLVALLGPSGSGKTTLLRMIAGLETPNSGDIYIDGKRVNDIPAAKRGIGFVFQNYALFRYMTVYENVAFGLELQKMPKKQIKERVEKLLEMTGLSEMGKRYPNQLSGGQRQRVAIARALASDPKILLCDEATSALDPQTTASILSLLKEINEKLGITIVIITHQMSVIREICSHVAIIEHGVLVEDGLVEDIFSHPKSKAAKELILRDQPGNNNAPLANAVQERMQGDKKIRIVFSENSAFEPVIANMILQFKTPVNILRADTKNVGGVAKGEMILGLPEDRHLQVDIEEYLKEKGLAVEEVTEDVE